MNTYDNVQDSVFTNPIAESNEENQYRTDYTSEQRWPEYSGENKVLGTLGALLGSLAGAVVYFFLNRAGFIASISGLAGTYCALTLYRKFAGRQSTYGAWVSIIFCLLSIVGSCYFCLAYDVFEVYRFEGISIWRCIRYGYLFLSSPEVHTYFLKDLIMGLLFCLLGISNALKRNARFGYY